MTTAGQRPLPATVVDASVATKWLLRDETDIMQADALLDRSDTGALVLVAPRQIEVEVAAALRRAVLNGRLTSDAAEELLSHWLETVSPRLYLAPNAPFLPLALRRSLALGITLFDAMYVVLAEETGLELVVADTRLLQALTGRVPFVRALRTYGE